MLLGSPAETAWPHGEARLATIAPGNVLSSEALTTFALRKYSSTRSFQRALEMPVTRAGGCFNAAS